MATSTGVWLFNIRSENWDTCVSGPQDSTIHNEEHVGNPVHGVRSNANVPVEKVQSGDLALARIKGKGIGGIWEIADVVDITDDPARNLWDDDDYSTLIYCEPIQTTFEKPFQEDWSEFAEKLETSTESVTGQLQGSVVELDGEFKSTYLSELRNHDALSDLARERLDVELHSGPVSLQDVSFWNIRAGAGGELWEQWNSGSEPKITIGWDIGDPETVDFEDPSTVASIVEQRHGSGPTNPDEQIRQFVTGASPSMEAGDFVLIHGDSSITAIAQIGEFQYQNEGLDTESTHTYWRAIDHLVSATDSEGVPKRALPTKFGSEGEASVYFHQTYRTIEHLSIAPEDFRELAVFLAGRDEMTVTDLGAEILDLDSAIVDPSISLSTELQQILEQWGTVARATSAGEEFDFAEHDRTEDIKEAADVFIENPTEDRFKQMWDQMHSAVQRGNSAERLKQWEGSIEELATLIQEMRDADEYDRSWREQLGGKTTVWELFGSLHIDDYPIINAATISGLEFFGYEEPSTYEEGLAAFSDFQSIYEYVVGHATADAEHDISVPIRLEIDQLFNVVDKANQESIADESSDAARELYQQILARKKDEVQSTLGETDEGEYSSVEEGVDEIWAQLSEAGESNWLRDELSAATIERWVDPLKAINHRTHSALEIRRCDEVLDFFHRHESRLTSLAEELDLRQFSQLNPAESLFVVLLRDVQEEHVDEGLINHVKFKRIREGYHRANRETNSYFVLRTGSDEYQDTQSQYEFRGGIPGYDQLRSAANAGEAVFLEDASVLV